MAGAMRVLHCQPRLRPSGAQRRQCEPVAISIEQSRQRCISRPLWRAVVALGPHVCSDPWLHTTEPPSWASRALRAVLCALRVLGRYVVGELWGGGECVAATGADVAVRQCGALAAGFSAGGDGVQGWSVDVPTGDACTDAGSVSGGIEALMAAVETTARALSSGTYNYIWSTPCQQ